MSHHGIALQRLSGASTAEHVQAVNGHFVTHVLLQGIHMAAILQFHTVLDHSSSFMSWNSTCQLKDRISRQQFKVSIQAAVVSNVIVSRAASTLRKGLLGDARDLSLIHISEPTRPY